MYESPNRTVKTLRAIEEAYNERHQVFIALELTKMNETHYRGEVSKVRSEIEAKIEEEYEKINARVPFDGKLPHVAREQTPCT